MRSKTTGYKKMTRQYTIADHLIEVTAPEDAALWEVCTNYTPFELKPCDGTKPDDELKPGNGAEPCDDIKPGNGAEPCDGLKPGCGAAHQKGMAAPSPLCSLQIVDELEVPETEPFYEVKQEGYPRLSFSRLDGGWAVRMAPDVNLPVLGVLMAAEDFRSARLKLLSGSARAIHFAVDNALMLMFALASAPFDTLEIHSSVTVCDGAGYAFLGKSGTGKSTHSRLWREHIPGSTLLNDDNPVIRIKDGQARIYGSPWSGKTPCYKAESAPLSAIVRIRQCADNRIQQLSPVEAYASIYSSCSAFREIKGTADGIHATLSRLVSLVPMYILDCRPDKEAAQLCHSSVSAR